MNRAEKDKEIELIGSWLSKGGLAVCADYRGLNVAKVTELRRGLFPVGAAGRVVKNTLAQISVDRFLGEHSEKDVKNFKELFEGPSMLIVSFEDPIAVSKLVEEFGKTNEAFQVKGGWFEGSYLDVKAVKALANMPSKQELQAKLLATIMAPATQLVRTINEPAASLARVLEAQRKKLAGE